MLITLTARTSKEPFVLNSNYILSISQHYDYEGGNRIENGSDIIVVGDDDFYTALESPQTVVDRVMMMYD